MLDELERMRAYRDDVTEPDAATTLAARADLLEAIRREPRTGPPPKLRKAQRRRRLALAGGLTAVGLAVAGVLGFQTAATPPSALAAAMNQLAAIAASQDWTGIPGPGQYIYTQSEGLTSFSAIGNDKECSVNLIQHRQIWIATDGSGAIAETNDDAKFTSAADKAICASAFNITDPASQNNSWSSRFAPGGLSLPTNDWKSLSTDPATLLQQVHKLDGGPNDSGEYLTNIADFMRESDAPTAIRAALYQATALVPGVKLLGPQTDPAGQSGLGVGFYENGDLVSELIFDQTTAKLIAEEAFDQSGKLISWTAYLQSKIVDTVPNYPMEQSGPPSSSATSATSTTQQAPSTTTTSQAASPASTGS